jgi:hypothetical protein
LLDELELSAKSLVLVKTLAKADLPEPVLPIKRIFFIRKNFFL